MFNKVVKQQSNDKKELYHYSPINSFFAYYSACTTIPIHTFNSGITWRTPWSPYKYKRINRDFSMHLSPFGPWSEEIQESDCLERPVLTRD